MIAMPIFIMVMKMEVSNYAYLMKEFISAVILMFGLSSIISIAAEPKQAQGQENEKVVDENAIIFRTSKTINKTIHVPAPVEPVACEVEFSTDYWQEDDQFKVEVVVENAQCGASNGKYLVNARTRNEAGEINSIKFEEVWGRNDDRPVKVVHTYSMNGDIELVRVRLTAPFNGSCICLE